MTQCCQQAPMSVQDLYKQCLHLRKAMILCIERWMISNEKLNNKRRKLSQVSAF